MLCCVFLLLFVFLQRHDLTKDDYIVVVIRAEGGKIVRDLMRVAGKARKGVGAAVNDQP